MSGLPEPGSVPDRAGDLAGRTADPAAVNVLVAPVDGGFDPTGVELVEGGYEGPNAGDLGRLAATVEALDALDASDASGTARLHYPEPDPEAGGPWLVVEPLSGRLSTAHAGRGRLVVDLADLPPGVDAGLRAVREHLADVLDAARPAHEHYPVERDEEGVFTRGMTTLSLAGVDAGGERATVRFDVSTTPTTRAGEVESLVADLACVCEARYEPVAEFVRSDPPRSLCRAAEAAAERAVGDWEYEWFPEPTAFSRLPTGAKLALGNGRPGAGSFGVEAYECCRAMLRGTLARYGGDA